MKKHAIYVKDGHQDDGGTVDFVALILDGIKTGETRSHNRLTTGKPIGIARGGYVYGEVILGKPFRITKADPVYEKMYIYGTEYDIVGDGEKWCYPVTIVSDYRSNPVPVAKHGNYATYFID